MISPCCATCVSWSNDEPAIATGLRRPDGADPSIGICRFHSPTLVALAGVVTSQFPETHCRRSCDHWMAHDHEDTETPKRRSTSDGVVVPIRPAP